MSRGHSRLRSLRNNPRVDSSISWHRATEASSARRPSRSTARIGRNPVGTGPFIFSDWEQGQRIVLTKNPDYWGGAPEIDELEFRVVQEDSSRILALEAGDVDVISNVSAQNIPLLRENSALVVVQQPTYRLFYWAFNCTKDVFEDVRVRQGFNYLIDRESLVENVLQGVGQPADAPILPTVVGYAPIGTYTYDLEKGQAPR